MLVLAKGKRISHPQASKREVALALICHEVVWVLGSPSPLAPHLLQQELTVES